MPKLPCVSGARVARALVSLGFERRRQRGSHLVLRRGSDASSWMRSDFRERVSSDVPSPL